MATATDTPKAPTADDVKQKSTKGFLALQVLTASCHGVLNCNIVSPDPKPNWFDTLSDHLATAKKHCQYWVDDLGPKISARIPTHIIDFGATFDAAAGDIKDLIVKAQKGDSKEKKEQIGNIIELFKALRDQLVDIDKDIADVARKLVDFGHDLQKDYDNLDGAVGSIQAALASDRSEIDKLNNHIKNLHAEIDAMNKQILASMLSVGIGIFLLIAGFALTVATGGAGAVVMGAGALAVTGGAIGWGIWQKKVNDDYDQIAADQKTIDADSRQVLALTGLSTSVDGAKGNLNTANEALSSVKVMWGTLRNVLEGVIEDLGKPNADAPVILDKLDIEAAQKMWQDLQGFAQQLLNTDVTVEKKDFALSGAA